MDFDEEDDTLDDIVQLSRCQSHYFHKECIVQAFKFNVLCPVCSVVYGEYIGTMPAGTMSVRKYKKGQYTCSGFSCGTSRPGDRT